MRLLNIAALASSSLLAGVALQQEPSFPSDRPIYRMDCDDWASVRPSDQEFWERMEPVELTFVDPVSA